LDIGQVIRNFFQSGFSMEAIAGVQKEQKELTCAVLPGIGSNKGLFNCRIEEDQENGENHIEYVTNRPAGEQKQDLQRQNGVGQGGRALSSWMRSSIPPFRSHREVISHTHMPSYSEVMG
jgi:hypothetical protein